MKTMALDGRDYIEAQKTGPGMCSGCAFEQSPGHCWAADRLAPKVFGASCDDKLNIVYVEVKDVK